MYNSCLLSTLLEPDTYRNDSIITSINCIINATSPGHPIRAFWFIIITTTRRRSIRIMLSDSLHLWVSGNSHLRPKLRSCFDVVSVEGYWSRTFNLIFKAAKSLSVMTLRLKCLKSNNYLAFWGMFLAVNSLRCYLIFLKGGRIARWHTYLAASR
jgi:hypothetical protein